MVQGKRVEARRREKTGLVNREEARSARGMAGLEDCAAAQAGGKVGAANSREVPFTRVGVVVLAIFLVAFTGAIILLNASVERVPLRPMGTAEFVKATVVEVLAGDTTTSDDGEMQGSQQVVLSLDSGTWAGQECRATSPHSNESGALCEPGLRVIALVNVGSTGELSATVYNYDRGVVLWALIAVFLAVLCLIGGRKGVLAAVGLVFTFACIIFLYLPLIYQGVSPFWAATLSVALISVVVMYLIGGWTTKTFVAIVGTIAGVLIAGMVAALFGHIGHISGLNVSDIETLAYVAQNSDLDAAGLLFSGILIASLGAVMDVAMSVASALDEIHANSPELGFSRLFASGLSVGRDMMGTMSNTLILAFAGSSVNTLVIIYAFSMPYLEFMNEYAIGIEILRGISGSLGVIMVVPLASFVSAALLSRGRVPFARKQGEGYQA